VTLRALIRDDRGSVAVFVALALPVLLGFAGLAVDVSHHRLVQNRLQTAADAAALAGVQSLGDQVAARADALTFALDNVPPGFGDITQAADVEFGVYDPADGSFTASAENVNAIRVTARRSPERGNGVPRFLSAFFVDAEAEVAASAVAARTITSTYSAPEVINLAPQAADYNEVYAYCFDYAGTGTAASRRSQMTRIARNITPAVTYTWPECPEGQSLSFRLRNVRDSRADAQNGRRLRGTEYNHYSDTRIEESREFYDFAGRSILETVRCDTLEECRPTTQGGVLPFGKNRTPNVETRVCVPGKFMYFGWEDRPPGLGWTDRDYDDILFVVRCPTGLDVAYGSSRLVR
jgi:hypothetical protein